MSSPVSPVKKHSIVINDHKTSISLEEPFWQGVHEMARSRETTLSAVVEEVERGLVGPNLSSAVRVAVLAFYKQKLADQEEAAESRREFLKGNGGMTHNPV